MTDQFKPGDKVQVAGKNYTVTSMKMVPVELLPNTVLLSPCEGHGLLKQFPVEVVTRVDPRREEVLDLALTIQVSPQLFVWGMRDVANRQNSGKYDTYKVYQAGRKFAEMYLTASPAHQAVIDMRLAADAESAQPPSNMPSTPDTVSIVKCADRQHALRAGASFNAKGTPAAPFGYVISRPFSGGITEDWAPSRKLAHQIATKWRQAQKQKCGLD